MALMLVLLCVSFLAAAATCAACMISSQISQSEER